MKPKNQVEYRPVSRLKELPGNPRRIKKDQFEKLKASINANADYFEARPCILSDRTGELVVIAGNQRLKAAKALKIAEIPTVLLPGLTEEREKEIIIRDNVENGDWDMDILANEWDIEALDEWGVDVPEFGDALDENTVVEDDFDDTQEQIEQRVQPGDIWQLGEHRLYCGDSTKVESYEALMQGEKAVLCFTDPPYGIATKGGRQQIFHKRNMSDIKNDKRTGDDLVAFLYHAFAFVPLANDCALYVCYPWKTQLEFSEALQTIGYQLKACIVWDKKVFGLNGSQAGYRPQHELIYYAVKGKPTWYGDKSQSDIWQCSREIKRDEQGNHPTPKPIALIAKAITNSSAKGDIVIDQFGGSGSTLIACEQLGRRCRMMELDAQYCDVILTRWEKLTGKKARKIDDKE